MATPLVAPEPAECTGKRRPRCALPQPARVPRPLLSMAGSRCRRLPLLGMVNALFGLFDDVVDHFFQGWLSAPPPPPPPGYEKPPLGSLRRCGPPFFSYRGFHPSRATGDPR